LCVDKYEYHRENKDLHVILKIPPPCHTYFLAVIY
jgi:hypothetical protein